MKHTLFYLLIFLVSYAQAQPRKSKEKSDVRATLTAERLENLKNGILVVRLGTYQLKIAAIKRLTNSENPVVVAENHELLAKVTQEVDSLNREIHQLFTDPDIFDFTEVYFMYDTDNQKFKDGQKKGYFLDAELKPDSTIAVGDRPYFMIYLGETPFSTNSRAVFPAFVIRDQYYGLSSPPFPTYVTLRKGRTKGISLKYVMNDLPMPRAILKLNEVLHDVYEKSMK